MASFTTGAKVLLLFAIVAVLVKLAQSQSCTLPMFKFGGGGLITGIKEPGQDVGRPDRFLCLQNLQERNVGTLTMDCISDGPAIRMWFINGAKNPNINSYTYTFNIDDPVNVSCVLMNECGNSTYPVIISNSRPIIRHSVIQGSNNVTGARVVCLNLTDTNRPNTQFFCPVVNIDESLGFERKWFKDMFEVADSSTLEFLTIAMIGSYRCVANNSCGADTASIEVNAYPIIRKGNGTISASEADIGANLCTTAPRAMLICHILNNIEGTRIWQRNGMTLPETGEVLTITPPTNNDDVYTCTVMNECTRQNSVLPDTASSTVFRRLTASITGSIDGVTGNGCNRPSSMDVSRADLCAKLSEMVTISCTTSATTESYTILGPLGTAVATNNSHTISRFTPLDMGTYTCIAMSACNNASDTMTVVNLGDEPTIPPEPPSEPCMMPPCNIAVGADICIAPGLTVNINCVANGTVSNYTWEKDGVFFSNNQNLTNVGPGTYTCTARNPVGSDSQTSKVEEFNTVELGATRDSVNRCSQLRYPPPARTDFCAFVGDRVTLRCTPSQPDVPTEINPDGEPGEKIFNSIQLQDSGNYLCNATTDCSTNTSMINIRVYDPATIDRGKTLPAPQENELVQGAGRTSEEVCGRDNNKISLHCCYSGFDQPTTMWLFIAEGSTQAVPINTSDPNIMISDDGMNSVLMINPFGEDYAGIYRCNTTNIAGTDAGDVNVVYKPPEEKEWLVSTWSRCFPDCHRGVRNRTVVCVTVSNRMVMDGCTPPPPPSEEQCTERGPCTEWVPGNWSVCTKTCGIGYQVRRVTCKATYDNTIELNDSECLTARPPVFRYCNIQDCPCVEPAYCSHYVGTEMCWRTEVQRDCCCTCGPAP